VIYATVARSVGGELDSVMIQSQISHVRNSAQRGLTPTRGVYPWRTQIVSEAGVEVDFGSPSEADASVGGYPGTAMRGLDLRDAGKRNAMERVLTNPGAHEVRFVTAESPEGFERARLRAMERVLLFPQSTGAGEASSYLEIDFTRGENGDPDSGVVFAITDMGTAAARAAIQSISLREGGANQQGRSVLQLAGAGGGAPVGRFGITAVGLPPENLSGLNALERLLNFPDSTYLQIETSSGVLRSQLGTVLESPAIRSVISTAGAVLDAYAPGSLITIQGERLGRIPANLDAWQGSNVPRRLNGVIVEVGGRRAPLLYVSDKQINAQVPFDVPAGVTSVAVHNGSAASGAEMRVRDIAPSLFEIPGQAAAPGEVLELYATGLGQTAPELITGRVVEAAPLRRTQPVVGLIGGQQAEALESAALAGLPGLYRVRLRVPMGVAAGARGVLLRAGEAASNSINVTVR